MSSDRPKVSFVTVNYRSAHLIRHLLQSIEDADLGFSFEYLVVDCDSSNELAQVIKDRFSWATYIDAGANLGFGRGNNLAFQRARGEYIALINPDVLVYPKQLESWVLFMESNPTIGLSGPRTVNPDGTDQSNCFQYHSLLMPLYRRSFFGKLPWVQKKVDAFLMKEMNREQELDVDWVMGSAMLIRQPVLQKLGGFDDVFFMYFEDTDLCRRTWELGYRVTYFPGAKLMHYHKRESRITNPLKFLSNRVAREHIKSAIYYFHKYRGKSNPRVSWSHAPTP